MNQRSSDFVNRTHQRREMQIMAPACKNHHIFDRSLSTTDKPTDRPDSIVKNFGRARSIGHPYFSSFHNNVKLSRLKKNPVILSHLLARCTKKSLVFFTRAKISFDSLTTRRTSWLADKEKYFSQMRKRAGWSQ